MHVPELLAPAGNMESLVSAIQGGCDAVYLAGKLYGARSFAGNFSNEELEQALKYAHSYGVKIYVTVNTLIYEDEVKNLIDYIRYLHEIGVDALIMQDIGMVDLVRKKFPNLEIHASTQMHIHNLEGVLFAKKLGIKRVVLARETPIDLIRNIKEKTNMEIEIFIHGALCISYSGQCLMSSLIGGRSGNRGTCAQSCRQPYKLYCDDQLLSDNEYILSTKDLNTLEHIGELIKSNVDSLKIEGRMKRPEYVFYVVSLYRKAIDNYIKYGETKITEKDIYNLKKIFNREFTKGFIFNEKNSKFVNSYRPNHIGIEIGKVLSIKNNRVTILLNDDLHVQDGIRILGKYDDVGLIVQNIFINGNKVESAKKGDIIDIISDKKVYIDNIVLKTSDYLLLNEINKNINSNNRKVLLNAYFEAKLGSNLKLIIDDNKNNKIEIKSSYIVDKAIKNSTSKEQIIEQLNRLGNTIYSFNNIDINSDDNIFIPVKFINDLRRDAITKIDDLRTKKNNIIEKDYYIDLPNIEYSVTNNLYTDNISSIKGNYDNYILPSYLNNDQYIKRLPRVNEYIENYKGKLLVGELGSLYKFIDTNEVYTDFSLNVTNSYSVALLHSLGVKRITLSTELNEYQINKLYDNFIKRYNCKPNLEVIVEELPEAMILKYDIFNGKYDKNKKYYIKDKYNNKFIVKRLNNLTYVYYYEKVIKNYNLENISTRKNFIEI